MSELHVYRNDVIEWYVASSLEDAVAVAREYLDKTIGLHDDEMDLNLVQEPDNKILSIVDENSDTTKARRCSTWARLNGRGFLCTTEF